MSQTKRILFAFILLSSIYLIGCTKVETELTILPTEITTSTSTSTEPETEPETEPLTPILGENEVINPLTGMPMVSVEPLRPIAVMMDNLAPARPQAGLSKADICYEILAEGRITRYLAVFYSNLPDLIGPVRSARPYFIEKAMEYNPYYVHVGGSNQAFKDIKKYRLADIDGLSSGAFWRENHKKIPHNMYTSSKEIVEDANNRGYKTHVEPTFLEFHESFKEIEGDAAGQITFVYKEPTRSSSTGYATSYKYNNETKLYYRYTNGKPHVDETDENQLTCSNILVQYADTKVIDNEGRLAIKFVGTGEGKLYTAGKSVAIKWEKETPETPTLFFTQDGEAIQLNPGQTWIQVMETGHEEIIEN